MAVNVKGTCCATLLILVVMFVEVGAWLDPPPPPPPLTPVDDPPPQDRAKNNRPASPMPVAVRYCLQTQICRAAISARPTRMPVINPIPDPVTDHPGFGLDDGAVAPAAVG